MAIEEHGMALEDGRAAVVRLGTRESLRAMVVGPAPLDLVGWHAVSDLAFRCSS
jgi:hypothetical protein